MKNELINDVLVEMMNDISEGAAVKLKNILIVKLSTVSIIEKETRLSVDVFDNKKILERFAIDQMAKGLKKSTIQQYLWIVKKFFEETGLSYHYTTGQDITDYLALRQYKDGISQSYKSTTLRYLSSFFGWAYRKKHIKEDIMLDVDRVKAPQKTKIRLTDEEMEMCRSMAAGDTEKTAILETMLSTGVRVGELKNLKVSDLNFQEGTIRIWGEKSSKERYGFMTPRFKVAIRKHLNGRHTGYLFQTNKGERKSYKHFEDIAKNLAVAAGCQERATVHVYRKTFASIMYRKTRDALLVSRLLGHASTETTVKFYLVEDLDDIKYKALSVA